MRDISQLKTCGLPSKGFPYFDKVGAFEYAETLQKCVEELLTLPQDEEWNCAQVCEYMGWGDCSYDTVGGIVAGFMFKMNDIQSYWIAK